MRYRQPRLAVDCIVLIDRRVVLIRRKNPPFGWALPGGFVNYGETVEQAVQREVKEETGLDLSDLRQFRVYSDPKRDPRGHCVSVVFVARGSGQPTAGDDAGDIRLVSRQELERLKLVFDHRQILADYFRSQAISDRR
ncbi:MAG: NUDIX domain-containing protein [candidate division WOR-3 bacterium]